MADPLPVVVRTADFIREFERLTPHRQIQGVSRCLESVLSMRYREGTHHEWRQV